jgi:hypothetical protein
MNYDIISKDFLDIKNRELQALQSGEKKLYKKDTLPGSLP